MTTAPKLVNGELILSSWYSATGLSPSLGSHYNVYDGITTIAMTESAWYFLDEDCNIHMRLSHDHWRKYDHEGRFHFCRSRPGRPPSRRSATPFLHSTRRTSKLF